jgi:hypothetical protein
VPKHKILFCKIGAKITLIFIPTTFFEKKENFFLHDWDFDMIKQQNGNKTVWIK